MSENKYWNSYRCPSCFKNWQIEEFEERKDTNMPCEFCSKANISSLELLHRRVSVVNRATPSDFPELIKHLLQHVVIKE